MLSTDLERRLNDYVVRDYHALLIYLLRTLYLVSIVFHLISYVIKN